MQRLFRLSGAVRRDPAVIAWLEGQQGDLGTMARYWFDVIRECAEEVRELMHDGCPTACLGDAAFAYVAVFKSHVNVGFFRGAELADPAGLLEGKGRFMRHVKLRPGSEVDTAALTRLIEDACADMKRRLGPG